MNDFLDTQRPEPKTEPSSGLLATYAQLHHLRVAVGNWRYTFPALDLTWADLLARVDECIAATGVTP